ncbi:hypothetical protein [Mucilaginibacter gotjawali]|uniref:Uncharacterized protein n=2 Tax=Mucilaginibacter gotjawali TaxID=1550579 RepID=A0A839SGZ8_9SPHI|nr:hypothetical protein [Mucilaginibacter gotjawali]MBB3056170.1 hypothetical protein [Mucilaginibacter gotjawali]BAU53489.1 hypothetical protein MgSA37_01657 [Mucilaginibacter gotjawali]
MLSFKKYVLSGIPIALFPFFVKGQKIASDKIYWLALDKYTLALGSGSHPNIGVEKVIYLQKSDYVDSIPPLINGYGIVLISNKNQKTLYKQHNRKLIHTIMSPVAVQDSMLYITITPYLGRLKGNRHYFLSVSEGTTVYFKFDSDKKQFVPDKIKNWGI